MSSPSALLDGRVVLRQPETGYRVAIDPVLLAAAVEPSKGARVLDVGCGTGAVMLCLAARRPDLVCVGLEREAESVALAAENVGLNNMGGRLTVVHGDLIAPPAALDPPYDAVVTNPPYGAEGTPPPDAAKAAAHMESDLDLPAWIAACLSLTKSGGLVAIVHRAERLSDIHAALRPRCGAINTIPLWPKAGRAAKRVIVTARKGGKGPDVIHPGLVLHRDDGAFTPDADAILRGAEAFPPI